VEWLERALPHGHRWEGRLYYPAEYAPGRRYPLVIQTHSFAPREEFSLYGRGAWSPATGPGISVYVAQLLAGRGMFVLHGRVSNVPGEATYLRRTQIGIEGTEALVEQLVREGKVDRERVGIMGYSATGWDVAYALTHSSFPYAAAITDDNKDGGYLQAAMSNWVFGLGEEMMGAPPFGEGLSAWLEHSPAFNAHRVTTPLLLTVSSSGAKLAAWETFSRLRYLRKPVEYFLIPDQERGSHGLQNPRQVLALQERALDWWCFWLKQEEDPQPAKAAQYTSWRLLRALQSSNHLTQLSGGRPLTIHP
jgi:dipeptidyl aminopeptidase/acylaminoacyl peptidase